MKVVYRLTGLLLLGACLVLTIYGLQTVRREALMFETTMIEDARLIGRTLQAALREVSRVEGPEGVRRLVADASQHDDKLEFRWTEEEELAQELSADERAQLAAGQEVVQVRRQAPNELRLYLSLSGAGLAGALEVRESLEREDAYIRKSLVRIGFATVLLILISGGSAFLIGVRVVGRPIERLIEKAHRVGQGDLSGPVLLSQRDEIGQLAAAMNEMCEQLRVETEQRREAEDQLRHAERLATVGKLSSGLAHELGTPLNVVLGRGLQIAEDERCPADLAEAAQIVVQQSERMSGIIRQLLDFARRGPPRVEPVDLTALAEDVAHLLEGMARRKEVEIELDLEPCGADLLGDAEQLRQA
ncbi:MAG TPA: histidine kinase, partial [Planctomycetes bacterium]|nr:histidine kinase [Planctomycetota bacterium]